MVHRWLNLNLARELASALCGRRRVYRVSGLSMVPTLYPGDVVLVAATAGPVPGEVVVVRDPERPGHVLVKRTRSLGDTTFAVGSDAPDGARDSRQFGSLPLHQCLGRATWVWSKAKGLRRLAQPTR